jgi:WD40 repeat protein
VNTLDHFGKEFPCLYPNTIAFHPFGSIVAYFLSNGSVQIYDLKVKKHFLMCCLLFKQLTLTTEQGCRLLQTHQPLFGSPSQEGTTSIHSFSNGLIQFSPDGRWLCTAVNSLQNKFYKIHVPTSHIFVSSDSERYEHFCFVFLV